MFKFRLASIQRLHEYNEKKCKEEVGKCVSMLKSAEARLAELEQLARETQEQLACAQEGNVAITQVLLGSCYLKHLHDLIQQQKIFVAEKSTALKEAQAKLGEAVKNRKITQKIREKQYSNFLLEENRREQLFNDELALAARRR